MNSAETGTAAARQLRSVQILRAIAALFVVAFHATVLWHDRFDPSVRPWQEGNAGVDLFFVISGFIMVWSSTRLVGLADGWWRFLVLRLVRITPMYWLATAAKLAAVAAFPAMALHTRPTGWNIAASFLFLPARDGAGVVRPVLDVGWTLSFEMLFYLAFAAALYVRVKPWRVVAPAMAVLALLSLLVRPDWPAPATLANPIVLEFVMGLAVGQALLAGTRAPPAWACLALAAAGIAGLAFVPTHTPWSRAVIWGLAATLTLGASVLSEPRIGRFMPRLAVRIGEASYSLYLTHGFVLPAIGIAAARSGLHGQVLGAALIGGSLVTSTAIALAIYRFVEVPITSWLRHLTHDRGRTTLAAPASPV